MTKDDLTCAAVSSDEALAGIAGGNALRLFTPEVP